MARPNTKTRYRSGLEERVCNNLRNRRIQFSYEPYKLDYTKEVKQGFCPNCGSKVMLKCHQYTPDIVLGNGIHVEIKGRFTGEMRNKMIAVRDCNPEIDIRFLFQRDGWCTKNQKMTYSQWCEKNGFDYAIGETIPSRWVE